MSERKVVNKYFPPDFDPAKIPRRSKSQQQQIKVRIMLPISIRCGTCGTHIYRGTKFNSRKEDVLDQTYLGIQIYRFYIKCKECSVEILLNTDPAGKSGYVVEAGARRTFEPEADEEEEKELVGDAVEIRRLASKRELGIHSALDELKSMKARRAHVSVDSILESLQPRSAPLQLQEEKEYQQQLDMFKRSRRVVTLDLMLQDWQPLQKHQVNQFRFMDTRSVKDDEPWWE
ncbi:hypothetical protein M8C21_032690 [Ambrosia artemisiifolia]|uniref:Splicing factor YJU2 n=1 Tax=Ambrosia artemisiifolia TaxID=4212 RepID=A0AAD5CKT1_AMBAR|nr:hypothetical protein M8C21_032690 [Ambrosia artemisiifolia]